MRRRVAFSVQRRMDIFDMVKQDRGSRRQLPSSVSGIIGQGFSTGTRSDTSSCCRCQLSNERLSALPWSGLTGGDYSSHGRSSRIFFCSYRRVPARHSKLKSAPLSSMPHGPCVCHAAGGRHRQGHLRIGPQSQSLGRKYFK